VYKKLRQRRVHPITDQTAHTGGVGGAFDSRLLTNSPHPLIATHGRITHFARLHRFKPQRVNLSPAPKQRAEQRDLFGWWGVVGDGHKPSLGSQVMPGDGGDLSAMRHGTSSGAFVMATFPDTDTRLIDLAFGLRANPILNAIEVARSKKSSPFSRR